MRLLPCVWRVVLSMLLVLMVGAVSANEVTPSNTTPLLPVATSALAQPLAIPLTDDEIRTVLSQLTDNVILPTYQQLASDTQALVGAINALCTEPTDAQLFAARAAWSQALQTWQTSEAFLLGPATDKQLDFKFYFRPIKKQLIQALLDGDAAMTTETVQQQGVGVQGFAALEYLLFDRDKTDTALSETFKVTRTCEYVKAIAQLLHLNSQTILAEWQTRYAEAFKTAGKGSVEFATASEAFTLVINRLYQASENAKLKLQVAVGQPAFQAGLDPKREQVKPYKLEAWRSGHTLANTLATLKGVERSLSESGLLDWLRKNQESKLANTFEAIFSRSLAIHFPSSDLIAQISQKDLVAVDALFLETQMLTRYFKQHLASLLNVSLGFNENDGD